MNEIDKASHLPDESCGPENNPGKIPSVRSIQFKCPDYEKFPEDKLKDHNLFRRLLLSLRDFAHANSALTFILQDVDFEQTYPLAELRRFQAYETSLIVSYCRPFSESAGEVPRLSFRALGVKLPPQASAIHDDLMRKRNKIFAHSDAGEIQLSEPLIAEMKRDDGSTFTLLHPPSFLEGLMFDYQDIWRINALVRSTNFAAFRLLQAMHPHFKDRYEVRDTF